MIADVSSIPSSSSREHRRVLRFLELGVVNGDRRGGVELRNVVVRNTVETQKRALALSRRAFGLNEWS